MENTPVENQPRAPRRTPSDLEEDTGEENNFEEVRKDNAEKTQSQSSR